MKIESNEKTLNIAAEYEKNRREDCQHAEEAIKDAHLKIQSLNISQLKAQRPFYKLLSHKKWSALTILSVQFCNIGDQGCKYLSQQSNFVFYSSVESGGNQISSSGVHHLSKALLPKMNELWLMRNNIGYEGIKYINKFICKFLKILYLDGNKLNYSDILHLFITPGYYLEQFSIFDNQLSSKQEHLFSLATLKFPYLQQFYTR